MGFIVNMWALFLGGSVTLAKMEEMSKAHHCDMVHLWKCHTRWHFGKQCCCDNVNMSSFVPHKLTTRDNIANRSKLWGVACMSTVMPTKKCLGIFVNTFLADVLFLWRNNEGGNVFFCCFWHVEFHNMQLVPHDFCKKEVHVSLNCDESICTTHEVEKQVGDPSANSLLLQAAQQKSEAQSGPLIAWVVGAETDNGETDNFVHACPQFCAHVLPDAFGCKTLVHSCGSWQKHHMLCQNVTFQVLTIR